MSDFDQDLFDFLEQYISEHKQSLCKEIIAERTRFATIILEDIHKEHNASAVIRTADCLGIQDIHLIGNEYEVSKHISMGSFKWVNLIQYDKAKTGLKESINQIKSQGYTVYATSPHSKSISVEEIPITSKAAFLFGNELKGLSDEAMEYADAHVRIPIHGFTESLNLSVSVAICLHSFLTKIKDSNIRWQLSQKEQNKIVLGWYKAIIRNAEMIEAEYYKRNQAE
ncbi:MAG: RNA methyltransferase [Bacteroidota bacterium]